MNPLKFIPQSLQGYIAQHPQFSKILENIGWLFFDKILRMGLGLLIGVWIARYLGPEQFGSLSFAIAFTWLFGAVSTLGLPEIVVRDLVRKPDTKLETLGTAAALLFLGGVLTYCLILITIFWIRPEDQLAKILVAILGSTMLFKASEIAVYWFESQVISKYTVWVQNGSFLIFAGIKVLLILNGTPLIAFAWITLGEASIAAIMLSIMLGIHGPRLRQLCVSLARAKILLKDSWPLLLSSIAVVVYMKIDQIMLGQMVGDEAVGIYSAAVRISEVWYFIPTMIVASVFPAILKARNSSEEQYYKKLQHLFDLMLWLSIGIALPMTFLSESVIKILFGETYLDASSILSIHIWASVFVFLGVASSKWFIAENRQILSFQRTTIGALANVILNFLFIPQFQAVGAATATIISYAIATIISDLFQAETRFIFFMKIESFNLLKVIYRIRILKNSL
ncbi:MAG: flippase [Deltaproteobacteria bacterium]|jgi:O-antigen/teichoic acid export membrane protein|nr:flippase [Deltaproteobacteria bacterium]